MLTVNEYRVMLRTDLYAFTARCFAHLNPQTAFLPALHLEAIAAKLEACRQGRIRRLIINIPPRYLKSISASVAFPAFLLGHDPSAQIICASYSQDLADKHARDCRAIMTSPWYQALFGLRVSALRQAVAEFMTTEQGFRLATSVGGVLTGRGADFIIIDDPLKPDEALSDAQRKAANIWFDHTVYTRLNDKERGCIIVIMQRLHEDDLVGHILGQEPWEVLRFSAIAEEDEEHIIETPYGTRSFSRKAGEALHPERESLTRLAAMRKVLGEWAFAGQYQQAPAPLGGGLVKQDWFKMYQPNELPYPFDKVIQSWDTANKATELSDYSACTTWGVKGKNIYLLGVLRKRLNYPDLKRAVCEQAALWRPNVILIEDKASGTQLIQELIQEGVYAVTRYVPEGDKTMRLHAQTAMIENGFVFIPHQASWLAEYLHELTVFPNGKHDDQADSTAQALDWIKGAGQEPGLLRYYRHLYEKEQRNENTDGRASA